jgi:hypothetical protein
MTDATAAATPTNGQANIGHEPALPSLHSSPNGGAAGPSRTGEDGRSTCPWPPFKYPSQAAGEGTC